MVKVNPEVELSILGTIMPPFTVVVSLVENFLDVSIGDKILVQVPFRTMRSEALTRIISAILEDDKVTDEHPLR